MSKYWIRHYDDCPRVDINKPPTVDALKQLDERAPHEAKTMRTLLSNPSLEFFRLATPAQTKGRFAVHYIRFPEGKDFPPHTHDDVYALIFIAEGRGYVLLDGNRHDVKFGDVIYVPPGTSPPTWIVEPIDVASSPRSEAVVAPSTATRRPASVSASVRNAPCHTS